MDIHEHYMKIAYKEALKALKKDEVPIGAIIVKNGEIIAKSHNTKEGKKKPTCHAEILAINKACKKLDSWHLDGCSMYVTLEPCPMCAGAILQAHIENVYYGALSFQDGALKSAFTMYELKGFNHYPTKHFYLQNDDCSKIISNYFKSKR